MTPQEKTNNILEKIHKLMKHAESARTIGSVQEAEVFTQKITALQLEYNISRSQIISSYKDENDIYADWIHSEYISYQDNQSGNKWRGMLIAHLANHNFTAVTQRASAKEFRVFGEKNNVNTTIYLYNFISTGLLRIAQQHYSNLSKEQKLRYNRYAFLKDFLIGAVTGINTKLSQINQSEEHKSLIVFNDKQLQDYIRTVVPNLRVSSKSGRSVLVGNAYKDGLEVGKNYQINQPLGQPSFKNNFLN